MCMGMSACGEWYAIEVVEFRGHVNVKATHGTTLEITKEEYLTPRGDCIIGVAANKSLAEFSDCFKEIARNRDSVLMLVLVSESGFTDTVRGRGDPALELSDPQRIIVRKSSYVAPNTVMVKTDKAAGEISRELIQDLRNGSKGLAVFIALRKKLSRPQGLSTRPRLP